MRKKILVVAVAACLAACRTSRTEPPTAERFLDGINTTDSRWVLQQNPASHVAVVFVHGIFGDTVETWTSPSHKRFFDLLDSVPEISKKTDMLAFGFPSAMFASGSFDIREAANRLHLRLGVHGILDYQKIIFVAHSMGGLVVLRELLTHREVLERVPVLVFLATPQEGSDITRIADHISNNPALSQMRPADANDLLKTLSDEWNSIPPTVRPHVRCAYEKLATHGVMIVPWSSATRFCEGSPPAIEADHISIVKPERAGDDAIGVVATALKDFVFNKSLEAKLETPDFHREGDHFVVELRTIAPPQVARLVNAGGASLRYTLADVSDPLLYLWPSDTPKDLPANGRENLQIALGLGAAATEYRFVLKTSVAPDMPVIVRVSNLAGLKSQQGQLAKAVSGALENLLSDSSPNSRLKQAGANNTQPDVLVASVRETIARNSPQLPEEGQWLLTADLLNATNWPSLAARALREAERTSPKVAQVPSAQKLAASAAFLSGDAQIFARAATPPLASAEAEAAVDKANALVSQVGVERATQLASGLEQFPALKGFGYSLHADAQRAAGDLAGAEQSLRQASAIRATPSVTKRLDKVRVASPLRERGITVATVPR
jgi:pimeloyl-ACP methyl ester carboxylesterase